MTGLRCLSLHQPWASLVAVGVKSIETRSWSTKHRGRIGIASTVKRPVQGEDVGEWWPDYDFDRWVIVRGGHDRWRSEDAPLGCLVATANLVDCVPIVEGAGAGPICVRVFDHPAALLGDDPQGDPAVHRNFTDQIPYGDFRPGRWAWLLSDVQATTERCPLCHGRGGVHGWFCSFGGATTIPCHVCGLGGLCAVCGGVGRCAPVPVKGRQGLWRWDA